MTGQELVEQLQQLLNEDDSTGWMDEVTSYDYLYESVVEFISRSYCITSSQDITTVEDQSSYDINTDFLKLYMKNEDGDYYVKYATGSTTTFLTWRDYEDIIYDNNNSSVLVPDYFSIILEDAYKLVVSPPPSTAGHTITHYYVKVPTKVTSGSGTYPIPAQYIGAIVKYAYWLYKYRDSAPNFADAMYKHWEIQVSRYASNLNRALRPSNIRVNFKKRI